MLHNISLCSRVCLGSSADTLDIKQPVRATPLKPAKIGWPPLPRERTLFRFCVRFADVFSRKRPLSHRCVAPSSHPRERIEPAFTVGFAFAPTLNGSGAFTSTPSDSRL